MKTSILNIMLLIAAGVFGYACYAAWTEQALIQGGRPEKSPPKAIFYSDSFSGHTAHRAFHGNMIHKNPFHHARPGVMRASYQGPVPAKERPRLFGTILLKGDKIAIIEDPHTKRTALLHINDEVAGYTVLDILEDKVVLENNGEPFMIWLRDDKKFKQKKRTSPMRRKNIRRNLRNQR